MVRNQLPSNTLVFIVAGVYNGCVGRVDRYTAKRVWVHMLEDATGKVHPVERGLTIPESVIRLEADHPRARPYPELRPCRPITPTWYGQPPVPPLRRAILDLVLVHAHETEDFDTEIDHLITALHSYLNIRHQHRQV
jgi:hypothetical protein